MSDTNPDAFGVCFGLHLRTAPTGPHGYPAPAYLDNLHAELLNVGVPPP